MHESDVHDFVNESASVSANESVNRSRSANESESRSASMNRIKSVSTSGIKSTSRIESASGIESVSMSRIECGVGVSNGVKACVHGDSGAKTGGGVSFESGIM